MICNLYNLMLSLILMSFIYSNIVNMIKVGEFVLHPIAILVFICFIYWLLATPFRNGDVISLVVVLVTAIFVFPYAIRKGIREREKLKSIK